MKLLAIFFAAILAAGASSAAGPGEATGDANVTTAPAGDRDWGGAYLGVFAAISADGDMYDIGGPYILNDDAGFEGFFGGYRFDFGKVVLGGEVALTTHVDLYQASFPTWRFTSITDLKATAGYEFGPALVYVAGGVTNSSFQTPSRYAYTGWNAGVGVDVMVTDRMNFGGEWVRRSVSRRGVDSWTGDFDAVQLRASLSF